VSHWYLVEPLQTLAVVWVLFIMVSARHWHASLTVAQLAAAVSFGLLVKLSTPAYVAVPVVVALVISILATRGQTWPRWWADRRFVASAVLAAVLAYATAEWYERNFQQTWQHAQFSAHSTRWGPAGSFFSHLSFWQYAFGDALFLPYFYLALLAILGAGAAAVVLTRGRRIIEGSLYPLLVLVGCLGTPAGVLVLLSSQVNWDVRYLTAVTPAVGLGLVAVLRLLDARLVSGLLVLLFAGQFALTSLQDFDAGVPARLVYQHYRSIPFGKSVLSEQLDRIVRLTCTDHTAGKVNTVGASYFWLNANGLNMRALEQFALSGRGCVWEGLGDAETDPNVGWRQLVRQQSPFFVTVGLLVAAALVGGTEDGRAAAARGRVKVAAALKPLLGRG